MRVSPISYYNTYRNINLNKSNINNQTNAVNQDNFSSNPLINNNKLAFNGVNKASLQLVQQIPLKERIATVLNILDYNELLVVGRSLDKAKQGLLKSADNLNNVIKKIYFIPDDNIKAYLAFNRSPEWEYEVMNLNNFDIGLLTNKKSYQLEPFNSFYISEGDSLVIQNKPLDFTFNTKVDLSCYIKNFAQTKIFKAYTECEIERINKKVFSELSKDVEEKTSKITFNEVGGQDNLIEELKRSIIFPLRYPEAYSNFDINRGFILYGPPGTGKTHIARALANEADVNFVSLNGSEMESKWVGESEANWRNLFQDAKEKQPTILFIDEIDAVTKERGGKDVYGDKVVNQILTLMTDIDNNRDNVFVIGATNNFKAIDKAIIRSGRFGKHLEVKMPDKEGVGRIFDIHTLNKPLDRNLNKESIIQKLYDLKTSGADIKYVVNEAHSTGYERAGIFKKMEDKTLLPQDLRRFWINNEDFEKAIQKFVETRNGTDRQPVGFLK